MYPFKCLGSARSGNPSLTFHTQQKTLNFMMLLWWQSIRSWVESVPYPMSPEPGTYRVRIHYAIRSPTTAGVKKSKNFHLSPGHVHQNFYLSCYQITCPCQGNIILALNFLLVRRTLGENICLSCLKFNLSRAPGQVIFLPLNCFTKPFLYHQASVHQIQAYDTSLILNLHDFCMTFYTLNIYVFS